MIEKKKIVGLTPGGDAAEGTYRVGADYIKSVLAAGALPLILPSCEDDESIEQLLDMCDGILLIGGPDIEPARYGEEKIEKIGEISEERDGFELKLAKMAFERDIPMLGICRGIQTLNVAFGGTLWQDIPSQINTHVQHATVNGIKAEHKVKIVNGKKANIPKEGNYSFSVNSFHHQAVKKVAEGFEIMAVSEDDGIIEAIYAPEKKFTVGIQWHPEKMASKDENAMAIFEAFAKSL